MSATFTEVIAALAARLATVPGLNQVHEFFPDSISPPCATVQPAPGDFLHYAPTQGDGTVNVILLVSVYVPCGDDAVTGQVALNPYLARSGASSVHAAINGTLGGVVSSASCLFARNYRAERWDEGRYLAVDFPVMVMT